jgi:CRP-like cAMP-binding protein
MPKLNRLLAALPSEDLATVEPHLEEVPLSERQILFEPSKNIDYVYFIRRGVIFISCSDPPIPVGSHGPEGFAGVSVALSSFNSYSYGVVQVAGSACRIDAKQFVHFIYSMPSFRHICLRYTLFFLIQSSLKSACVQHHAVERRCATRLLTIHDQAQEKTFPLTQEYLAKILGVRRPTVSLVVGRLQRKNLIGGGRGYITVADRKGLEQTACSCYSIARGEYERLKQPDFAL